MKILSITRASLAGALLCSVLVCSAAARIAATRPAAVAVRVVPAAGGWQILREDKPYTIKGAGGSGDLARLKAAGANSVRTWDAENTDALLEEAQKLGMTVTLGIWLGQERQGFNYNDPEQVARQTERVRSLVLRYKDHPAVLMWGLGNEMEGTGDNAAIWSAINSLADMVKKLDPNHPVMTVVAEIGGAKVRNLHRLCPNIDVVGINSYAGAESIPKRYKEAGGSKPYVLTEFGPPGTWEVGKTAWGAILEPSSTEKANWYRRAWEQAIAHQPVSLGGYAFVWGAKQEGTATWFGMLLPDGRKLGAVDVMTAAWTGNPPAQPCPVITRLKAVGPDQVDPGATVKVSLEASASQGMPKVQWSLQAENDHYATGGDAEKALPSYPGALVQADAQGATVRLPMDPGGYRLYAYVYDEKGGAATANIPLLVKGEFKPGPGRVAKLPLMVYDEATRASIPYAPTGWMGSVKGIKVQEDCSVKPLAGKTCLRCEYSLPDAWAGVVWQNPVNDWGDQPGGWNLTGAKRLVFSARGEKGGEAVSFQFGLLGREKRFFDTAQSKLENVKLTTDWKEYAIDLTGKDLSRIKTGFCWVVAGQGAPVVFYLDNIRYE